MSYVLIGIAGAVGDPCPAAGTHDGIECAGESASRPNPLNFAVSVSMDVWLAIRDHD